MSRLARTLVLIAVLVTLALSGHASEIRNPSSGLCLDSFGTAGEVRMHPCHGSAGNQDWVYHPASGELRNPSSGLCLDSWGKAGPARMNSCHGQRGNQQWVFAAASGELRNPSSGLCLDSWGQAGPARMNSCHGQQGNQQFAITGLTPPPSSPPPPSPPPSPRPPAPPPHAPDGGSSGRASDVRNPSSGLCLDSFGRAGEAQMNRCDGSGGNQHWVLDSANGELRNPSSGLCLDSWGKAGPARTNNCHGQRGNQQWVYLAASGELRNPSSGLCLDSWGQAGPARMNNCHGQRGNQQFALAGPEVPPSSGPTLPIVDRSAPDDVKHVVETGARDVATLFAGWDPIPGLRRPTTNLGGPVSGGYGARDLAMQLASGIVRVLPQTAPSLSATWDWRRFVTASGSDFGAEQMGHIQSIAVVPGRGYLVVETAGDSEGQRVGLLGFYDEQARQLLGFEIARPNEKCGYSSNVDVAGDFFVVGWSRCPAQLYRLQGQSIEHLGRYDTPVATTENQVSIAYHEAHRTLYLFTGSELYRSTASSLDEVARNHCSRPGGNDDAGRPSCWEKVTTVGTRPKVEHTEPVEWESASLIYDRTSQNLYLFFFAKGAKNKSKVDVLGDYPEVVIYQKVKMAGTAQQPSAQYEVARELPLIYPPETMQFAALYPTGPSFRWAGGAGVTPGGALRVLISPRSMRHGVALATASLAPSYWETDVNVARQPYAEVVELGTGWSGTEALTSAAGHLFAVNGGKLWKVTPAGSARVLANNWAGTRVMAGMGAAIFAVQGFPDPHLWQAAASNGASGDLGAGWGGTEAMTSLGGSLYVVQGGKLWRKRPGQASQELGDKWGGTECLTSDGSFLYAVQGGKLWKTDANGKSSELASGWGGTAAMAVMGQSLFALRGGKLIRFDLGTRSSSEVRSRTPSARLRPGEIPTFDWIGATRLVELDGSLFVIQGDHLRRVDL